jgi:hypothetical protein
MQSINFRQCPEGYLYDTFVLLRRAFPTGLERRYYDTLCLFLKPAFGARVFADFITTCMQADAASDYNEALRFESYIQGSLELPDSITTETIQFVYERLTTVGYKAWQADCFEKEDIKNIERIVSNFLPGNT